MHIEPPDPEAGISTTDRTRTGGFEVSEDEGAGVMFNQLSRFGDQIFQRIGQRDNFAVPSGDNSRHTLQPDPT